MPLYVCDTCSGIENTALGATYHKDTGRFLGLMLSDHSVVVALCSECTPPELARKTPAFTWHGQFPKEIATEEIVRKYGLWPNPPNGHRGGLMHLGKFEYLRPELEEET